jgi:hypothetical protein
MHHTKQIYYNEVKGQIQEIINTDNFPSIVLFVGHENKRPINICFKKELLDSLIKNHKIGDYIVIRFFLSSRFKHGRWYTMANALEIIE